ncbi:hypothetical protein EV361DRAFT_809857, partial [Lentinula raphanica]
MNDNSYTRPTFSFQIEHLQAQTHTLKLLKARDRVVPICIGPSIPRRDRPEVYERYSRLMLILFKPWRKIEDLRESSELWSEAFAKFKACCDTSVVKFMDNMQLLHECKDSRDDHFQQRR